MKLSNNTILITGGATGIGRGFTEEFIKLGNTVIICGRRADRLQEVKDKYPAVITKVCDVANEVERKELTEWIFKNHPDLNVLINNAGVQLNTDLSKLENLDRMRMEIETNLIAPVQLASLFTNHLISKKDAVIINITSGLAFVPLAFMPVYCATKAALHSITLSLRHQLKNTSVKVFEIAPPAVDTELGHDRREDKAQSHGGIPVNEFLAEAMDGLKNDVFETAVGMAKGLRSKREEAFDMMNSRN